jgi:hypothetical protein
MIGCIIFGSWFVDKGYLIVWHDNGSVRAMLQYGLMRWRPLVVVRRRRHQDLIDTLMSGVQHRSSSSVASTAK